MTSTQSNLKILNRNLNIAADDLYYPSIIAIFIRIIFFIVILSFTVITFNIDAEIGNDTTCIYNNNNNILKLLFFYGLLLTLIGSLFIYLLIAILADRGALVEWDKRSTMDLFIYFLILCYLGELVLGFVGVGAAMSSSSSTPSISTPQYNNTQECQSNIDLQQLLTLLSVLSTWGDVIIFFFVSALLGFASNNVTNMNGELLEPTLGGGDSTLEQLEALWERRCKVGMACAEAATCRVFLGTIDSPAGEDDDAFRRIAQIFAAWFNETELHTLSDCAATLLLLRAEQRKREVESIRALLTNRPSSFTTLPPPKSLSLGLSPPSSPLSSSPEDNNQSNLSIRTLTKSTTTTTRRKKSSPPTSLGSFRGDHNNTNHRRSILETFLWSPMLPTSPTSTQRELHLKMHLVEDSHISDILGVDNTTWLHRYLQEESRAGGLSERREMMNALRLSIKHSKYMLGIYGTYIYLYMKPATGLPRLLGQHICSSSSGYCCSRTTKNHFNRQTDNDDNNNNTDITKDTLHFTKLAFKAQTGLTDKDILYTSFTSYMSETIPFVVAVDHKIKSIIITCRGTMSLGDMLTDALIEPEPLTNAGITWGFDGSGHYAHRGMYRVASRLRMELEKIKLLDRLFRNGDGGGGEKTNSETRSRPRRISKNLLSPEKLQELVQEMENLGVTLRSSSSSVDSHENNENDLPDCSSYNLVVIGHSLGAGVASILSLLLRPKFPGLQCIAYAPPGCMFSKELADLSEEWIVAPFLGSDLVPRANWRNLKHLRGQMLDVLRRSKCSKRQALASLITNESADKLLYDADHVPNHPLRQKLEEDIYRLAIDKDNQLEQIDLFPPGKLVHIAKVETIKQPRVFGCGKKIVQRNFRAFHVKRRENLDEFKITPRMILDHLPDILVVRMEEILGVMESGGEW